MVRVLRIPAFLLLLALPTLFAEQIGELGGKPGNLAQANEPNDQSSQPAIWARELRAIEREGHNSDRARAALQYSATGKPTDIPVLLDGFSDANPIARNLLRGAIEALADRFPRDLPLDELEARIKNPQDVDPHARGLAFELLQQQAPQRAAQLVPELLHDPNPDLRRLAVAQAIENAANRATEGDQEEARTEYERALTGAIDRDQVTAIVAALKPMGREVDLPRHFGFVTNWTMIGPFDNTAAKAFDVAYPPEQEWAPNAEYQGKSGPVQWRSVSTQDDFGIVDVKKELEQPKGAAVYLTATVESDGPRSGELRLGTQNAWKVWLNGKFLFGYEEYHRGMIMDQHRIPIQLQPGENRFLLKLLQNEQTEDWAQSFNFQLRLTDSAGQALLNQPRATNTQKTSNPDTAHTPSAPNNSQGIPISPNSDSAESAKLPQTPPSGPVSLTVSDWGRFRGPGATGEVAETNPPSKWEQENPPGWRSPLPGGGFSQPVVAGDRVFTTCSSGFSKNRLHVVCQDLPTGKLLWHRQYWATGRTSVPEDMRVATPTPVATEDHVFCLFSSGDLACLDHEGNLTWFRGLGYDYQQVTNNLGMGSSPTLAHGALVCQMEADSAAYTIGLNPSTGNNLWQIDRMRKANWTSPIPGPTEGKKNILLEGGGGVESIDPTTGKRLWLHELGASTVSSLTLSDQTLLVPADGLTALHLSTNGEKPEPLWNNRQLSCSFVSPVVAENLVLIINSAGVLRAADLATGKMAWQVRLGGSYWGTPTVAASRVYCPDREGRLVIVGITEKSGEILAEHEIGEPLHSPPVLVKNSILLRTDTQLIRIGEP